MVVRLVKVILHHTVLFDFPPLFHSAQRASTLHFPCTYVWPLCTLIAKKEAAQYASAVLKSVVRLVNVTLHWTFLIDIPPFFFSAHRAPVLHFRVWPLCTLTSKKEAPH